MVPDFLIGAAIILVILFGGAALTADVDEERPSLFQDLLLALTFVYILRYLRRYR
jgi:hypothetical protein